MSSLAGEDYRRAAMAFRIHFEGGFQFDIFPVRQILGHTRSALFFGSSNEMLTPGSIILDGKFEILEEVKKTESVYRTGVIETFRLTPVS